MQFTKETHGGTVDISRQNIDWTSAQRRGTFSLATWPTFTRSKPKPRWLRRSPRAPRARRLWSAADDLADWATALYTAAAQSLQRRSSGCPTVYGVSLDVWAALGALIDVARIVLPDRRQ